MAAINIVQYYDGKKKIALTLNFIVTGDIKISFCKIVLDNICNF